VSEPATEPVLRLSPDREVVEIRLDPGESERLVVALREIARARTRVRPAPIALSRLTPREFEVLRLIGRGLDNAEIADHLSLSVATVKSHVGHILAKLGARDRVQVAVIAHRAGLVD